MSKHVLDRPTVVTNELLRRVVAIQRKALPRFASLALQRRQRARLAGQRLSYFFHLDRNKPL